MSSYLAHPALTAPAYLPLTGGTVTGPILFPDGTAAAPSIGWASDADGSGTGFYRSAANAICMTANGTAIFTFATDTGDESIGTPGGNLRWNLGGHRNITFLNNGACQLQFGDLGNVRTKLGANSVDGDLLLQNNASTDFGKMMFGGTTSSFPALKRSTTTLQFRLADDSAFAAAHALQFIGYAGTASAKVAVGNGGASVGSCEVDSGGYFGWWSGTAIGSGALDSSVYRVGAAVLKVGTGAASGSGELRGTFLRSDSASGGIGYTTGAGSTVTQATSKANGVTINAPTGAITMHNASLNANTTVAFAVTCSAVAATDAIIVNHSSAGTAGSYLVWATSIGAGSFQIQVRNITGGALSEAIVLTFAVVKGATS